MKEVDQVLAKDRHPGSKFRLPFEPKVWEVTNVKGTMITVRNGEEFLTRNVSFFKKYVKPAPSGNTENKESANPSSPRNDSTTTQRMGAENDSTPEWPASGTQQREE